MNLKKYLIAILTLVLVFGAPEAVFATADANASVTDDGTSYSYTDDSDEMTVANEQDTWLANADLGIGVSGGNTQSDSDDGNEIATGDADGTGTSANFANSNVASLGEELDGSSTSDATVGQDGEATAYAYDSDSVSVENYNSSLLENLTLGMGISGLNSQDGNDDGNSTTTGNTDAMAAALNEVNSNWTTIEGGHSAHATAGVGDDGTAYAYADDSDSVEVYNYNMAEVQNASLAFAVSGGNSQSDNDDDNAIEAGDSIANSSASNFVNTNVTVVGPNGGSASSDATVGEDGDSVSQSFDNDTVAVANSNEASVENVSVAAGVSGGNTQSGNDDTNSIKTGKASGNSCSVNTVNSNWTVVGGTLPEGGEGGCN